MKQKFSYKMLVRALLCLILVFSLVAGIAPRAVAVDDDGIITLAEPSRIFNDDGTVTVTYDMPLSPYSKIYGQPINSGEFVLVCDSTNIYFTQEKDEWLTVFTSLHSRSGVGQYYSSSSNPPKYSLGGYKSFPYDPDLITTVIVNGVSYPILRTASMYGVFWLTNYTETILTFPTTSDQVVLKIDDSHNPGVDGENLVYVWVGGEYEYDIQFGYYEDIMISQHEYDALYPVLYPFGETNYIDISDIRSGGTFDVSVTYDYNIQLTGTDTTTTFIQYVDFYDENGKLLSSTNTVIDPFDVADGSSMTLDTKLTVPEGACYMDMEISTDPFAVSDVQLLDWRVSDMQMTFDMSDVEANSLMMSGIIDRLDQLVDEALETNESLDEIIKLLQQIIADQSENGCDHTAMEGMLQQILDKQGQLGDINQGIQDTNDKLDSIINGENGFDSSGSDFSDAAGDLQNSSTQMNDALSGGMQNLDTMMAAPAMTTTLTTLAAGFDALFVGHEVTICGVTSNPFELIVSIGAIAILLPLALKLIFRKWGSGSSGGDTDA